MHIDQASRSELEQALSACQDQHQQAINQHLKLDLTRGKPSSEQLDLSDQLDGILNDVYTDATGTDIRNYGVLDGLPQTKALFASLLGVDSQHIFVGGNSSLSLMHYTLWFAMHLGLSEDAKPWQTENQPIKILCPVPGYDRHFSLCAQLGIEMIPVPLTGFGPDMDIVEKLVAQDSGIKGIWCVPRFSNPTGEVYCDETVERLAALAKQAGENFYVLWDNAYCVHSLNENAPALANIGEIAKTLNTEDSIIQFGSTSKITYAGAGIGFLSSSAKILKGFTKHFSMASIGSDKLNQMRHVHFLKDLEHTQAHMQKHAAIIEPKFSLVEKILTQHLADSGMGEWSQPQGGYFISFNTQEGLAKQVIALAADAGVKLTPAGATFPNGNDPDDKNIRLAPTFPTIEELEQALSVFVNCVKLASIKKKLKAN